MRQARAARPLLRQGRRMPEVQLEALLAEEEGQLGSRIRLLIEELRAEWRELDLQHTGEIRFHLGDESTVKARRW